MPHLRGMGQACKTREECQAHCATDSLNYAIVRTEDKLFHAIGMHALWESVKLALAKDEVLTLPGGGLLDENAGSYGTTNLCCDIDLRCCLDYNTTMKWSTELAVVLCKLQDILVCAESTPLCARSYNIGNVRLQVDAPRQPPSQPTASLYSSPPTRKDKVSVHLVLKPSVPFASNDTIKLVVLTALAHLLATKPAYETACFVMAVDLGIYSSASAHLRLPMTMKREQPDTLLRPAVLVREGSSLAGPRGAFTGAQLEEWLRLISCACTLNYIPTERTDVQFGAVGHPASLPLSFMQHCQGEFAKALRAIRNDYEENLRALCKGELANLLAAFRDMCKRLGEMIEEKQGAMAFEHLRAAPTWAPARTWKPFMSSLVCTNAMCLKVVACVLCGLSDSAKRKTPLKLHSGRYFSADKRLNSSTYMNVAGRIERWFDTHEGSIRLPFLSVHTHGSFLPLHAPETLECTYYIDADCDCVVRTHSSAKLNLKLVLKLSHLGRPEVVVKFGCWREGCRRDIHATLDSDALAALERHFQNTHALLATQHESQWLRTAPPAFAPLSYEPKPFTENHLTGLASEFGRLEVYLREMRPFVQRIQRSFVVTGVEQTATTDWTIHNDLVSPAFSLGIKLPLEWTDQHRLLFKTWAAPQIHTASTRSYGLGRSNPGIVYLTWKHEVVGYSYLTSPSSVQIMCKQVVGTTKDVSQGALLALNPLAMVTDAGGLLRFQMALHMCRPYSSNVFKLLFKHNDMQNVSNSTRGGQHRLLSQCDQLIWQHVLRPLYVAALAPEPPESNAWFSMVTRPIVPAEEMSFGRACRLSKAGSLSGTTDGASSATPTKAQVTANSNPLHNAIGFAPLVQLASRFREIVRLFPNLSICISSSLSSTVTEEGAHATSPAPLVCADALYVTPNFVLEELTLDANTKTIVFQRAQLFDSLRTVQVLEHIVGLLPGSSSTHEIRIRVLLPAHCYPPASQLGAPWIVAAHEIALKPRVVCTSAEGNTRLGYPLCYDKELVQLVQLLSKSGINRRLPGASTTQSKLRLHVTYNTPTQLPSELRDEAKAVRRELADIVYLKQGRGGGKHTKAKSTEAREAKLTAATATLKEKVEFFSAAQACLELNPELVKALSADMPPPQTLDDVDWCPQHVWPEHVVLLCNSNAVPHQVVRLLAAFQQGQGYPGQLHIVIPMFVANKAHKRTIEGHFKPKEHRVLQPYQTANTAGCTTAIDIALDRHYLGV